MHEFEQLIQFVASRMREDTLKELQAHQTNKAETTKRLASWQQRQPYYTKNNSKDAKFGSGIQDEFIVKSPLPLGTKQNYKRR